jgi:hypothetical protein
MDSKVVIASIWFRGQVYKIHQAALIDDQPIVEIEPPNDALRERMEAHLRSQRNFNSIPLTFSGPYKYFPEDAAEFEAWRYQRNRPPESSKS